MIKPVTFTSQGQQLIGILHVPDELKKGEKAPGIAMFHGFSGNKTETHRLFVHVARALCEAGYVVLRFDFRGSGDSDGEFEDMTVSGELSDAEESLTFLTNLEGVDKDRLGVIGLSLGGRVAAILASKDERVKFAVLYSASLGPREKRFLERFGEGALEKLDAGEAVGLNTGWYLKKPFFETFDDPIPFDIMHKIKAPVLIVHSDGDEAVSIDEARKGYEIVKDLNSKNELHIVRGGSHTFRQKEHTSEVIEKTLEWLDSLD
ncbi:MAG: alpha/beta fold hydrolase [Candidatus Bathyarchaeota archaeon]|nr:alpha/beta fold hydrolase [Candidatus Bathyarchaeota archaeon]